MERHITAPFNRETAATLKAGDYVYISGTVYTARDAAHKRMQEALETGETLPLELSGNVIYYMGPSPAREGRTYDSQPDGQICSEIVGSGIDRHDRQRKAQSGRQGCHCPEPVCLFCSSRWSRSFIVQGDYKV